MIKNLASHLVLFFAIFSLGSKIVFAEEVRSTTITTDSYGPITIGSEGGGTISLEGGGTISLEGGGTISSDDLPPITNPPVC